MKEARTEIEIGASPERVWGVLSDFPAMSTWNPFLRSIEGEPRARARIVVRIQPPGGKGMTFKPTVLRAEPNRELRWLGRLMMPGLFDGDHYFVIESIGEDRCRFVQGEQFRGLLVPLFGLMGIFGSTQRGFEEMNEAIKRRAEEKPEG